MEWPDHGVSEDPGIVLGLLNEIHLKHESVGKNAPIVVHCRYCRNKNTLLKIDELFFHITGYHLNG